MKKLASLLLVALLLADSHAAEQLRFGSISVAQGVFVIQVLEPAGTRYRLESSTDLKNWSPLGVPGQAQGCACNTPSGFLHTTDLGERLYIRIVPL